MSSFIPVGGRVAAFGTSVVSVPAPPKDFCNLAEAHSFLAKRARANPQPFQEKVHLSTETITA
jgi:hypothetical protein